MIERAAALDQGCAHPRAAIFIRAFDQVITAEAHAGNAGPEAITAAERLEIRITLGRSTGHDVIARSGTIHVPFVIADARFTALFRLSRFSR
jgi:hypothetical protein